MRSIPRRRGSRAFLRLSPDTRAEATLYYGERRVEQFLPFNPNAVINPFLVLCTVVGLSVEDLSEAGGPFLGIDELTFHRPVYPGDTLTARSDVDTRKGFTPMSIRRVTALGASLVCSVENTR